MQGFLGNRRSMGQVRGQFFGQYRSGSLKRSMVPHAMLAAWGVLFSLVTASHAAVVDAVGEGLPTEVTPMVYPLEEGSDSQIALGEAALLDQVRLLLNTQDSPLNLSPDAALIEQGLVITDGTISETSLTPPSLWWSRDQIDPRLGGHRLVEGWIAYRGDATHIRRIDLVLNSQIWNLLAYVERYQLVHQFGLTAKTFGYSVRIFSGTRPVAAYVCNFDQQVGRELQGISDAELVATISCTVGLDSLGQYGLSEDFQNLIDPTKLTVAP